MVLHTIFLVLIAKFHRRRAFWTTFPIQPGLSASTRHTFATSAAGTESGGKNGHGIGIFTYMNGWLFLLVTYGKDR